MYPTIAKEMRFKRMGCTWNWSLGTSTATSAVDSTEPQKSLPAAGALLLLEREEVAALVKAIKTGQVKAVTAV
jgi:hypothetical protein